VPEYVYDASNTSLPVMSNDFDYAAVVAMNQSFAAAAANAATVENLIQLKLPLPEGIMMPTETMDVASIPDAPIVNLPGLINALAPIEPGSDVLAMAGIIQGLPTPTSFVSSDHNFFMFVDPVAQTVEGGAVVGDTYFRIEMVDGAVVFTAFPFEVGLCRLEEARAQVESGPGAMKNMTKAERRAYKQGVKEQKLLGRQQKKEDAKAARADKKAQAQADKEEKLANKGGGWNKAKRGLGEHGHDDHAHGHDHHHDHDHDHDHEGMHRQLQTTGRLLVFIDFAPPSGFYNPWNVSVCVL
jgi:hypothetical protein